MILEYPFLLFYQRDFGDKEKYLEQLSIAFE